VSLIQLTIATNIQKPPDYSFITSKMRNFI